VYEGMERLKSCCNFCSVIGRHVAHFFHFSWDPGQVPVGIRGNDFGEGPHVQLSCGPHLAWALILVKPVAEGFDVHKTFSQVGII